VLLILNNVKIGDQAPDFSLPDAENRTRTLKEFLGQKVVLVFLIGAFTSTCTKEVCEFRDSMARLINLKAQIVGVDINVPSVNKSLAEKNRLSFPVLSDRKHEIFKEYGLEMPDAIGHGGESVACCWGKGCYPIAKRAIFILDEDGFVRYKWVFDNQAVEPSYEKINEVLQYKSSKEEVAKALTVITISRQTGSGGDEIAQRVSEILGYAYFDKNLLVNAAKDIGICEEDIADFSEDTYKIKHLVDKILLRQKKIVSPVISKDDTLISKTLNEEESISVVQTVINSLAGRGKIVIVGRGGQAILKQKTGVLHVRIIAPIADRVQRIMKSKGLSQQDALKLIAGNDKTAAEYLSRFYYVNWEDPAIYDVVLNTWKMNFDTAAKMIVSLAKQQN
jgi:peroxiredoxin/cytidylate kinase